MEHAVAHGYLMARVKGYADKRERGRRSSRHDAPKPTEDWAAGLRALSGAHGAGASTVATSDRPVAGLTTEAFRSTVAAMRAAEYERARARQGRPD